MKHYILRYNEAKRMTDNFTECLAYQKALILQELLKEKLIVDADTAKAIQEIEKLKKALESLTKGEF